ncbi:phosphoribosylglycinamide formyltransferase [Henriciella aquimarina]|uniref:phosphoribosylglycinamide formyltransferase n=1 Tax=Henriciella aquimarina TaxID=545261 RepID=UPI0009FF121D|nr:phosphoribosylglycinamide formyltransferase [Henriciella aquimarina]
MSRLRLAILISGRGTNMERLLQAAADETYPARACLVLSNRANAAGLDTARAYGVEALAIPHKDFEDRERFEHAMDAALREHGIEILALAGFMRVLTPWFVRQWEGRMINIHPSLLPKYPGLDTHKRAIEAGDAEAGCSVHWVSESVDAGDVIAQARVPVKAGDTPEELADRVLVEEHVLYPHALAQACEQIQKKPSS